MLRALADAVSGAVDAAVDLVVMDSRGSRLKTGSSQRSSCVEFPFCAVRLLILLQLGKQARRLCNNSLGRSSTVNFKIPIFL